MFSRLPNILVLVLVVTMWPDPRAQAADVTSPEGMLAAMTAEMKRNASRLRVDQEPPPYFIAYRVKDIHSIALGARHGAIFEERDNRSRLAQVEVRVGDYDLDNSEDVSGASYEEGLVYQPPIALPLEGDEMAIRTVLWLLTDQRYKEALTAWHRVRAQGVYRRKDKDRASSFSREEPSRHRDEVRPLQFDTDRWRSVVRAASARAASRSEVLDSEARVETRDEIRCFVNTEGSEILSQSTHYGVHVSAWTLSTHGKLLEHSVDLYARSEDQLPGNDAVLEAVDQMLEELIQLREAPVFDPYTGPALLLPRATGVLFHEAIGHRLEGHRQDDSDEGRTFSGQLGKSILPSFLSVIDDPTRMHHEGVPLNGHYRFDDEGVPASRSTLVEEGRLVGFLMRRKPVKGVDRSNGHGRAEGVSLPVSRMGTLFVLAGVGVERAALKKALIDEARRQGKPFAVIVSDLTGGSTNTMTHGYQAFKGIARGVLRVDIETGEETLVRGVEIVGTPLSSMNKIIAAGTETGVFNGYCGGESGWVPVSTVAPALLFREIELQRTGEISQRGPVLPNPSGTGKGKR